MDEDIPELIERRELHQTKKTDSGLSKLDSENSDNTAPKRVPCTIITGFLGAGKSTLLKRILTERHGYRIAVIMNEFGDTADIEARAINVTTDNGAPGELSEEFLELANGCLCCSIKDVGIAAIEKLMQKKGAFDYILLETTGLADPGPIAAMLWQNEDLTAGLGRDICLDGVVTVVDGIFAESQIQEETSADGTSICLRQIASADVIILNKADIAEEMQLSRIENIIRITNPSALVYRTVRGQIDLKYVIGIDAYGTRPLSLVGKQANPWETNHDVHDNDCQHDICTTHEGITSLQISCPLMSVAHAERLDEWIRTALWEGHLLGDQERKVDVLRCKGMYMMDSGEQYVLQGVRSLYDITKIELQTDPGFPIASGKLVFIGRGLDEVVRKSLLDFLR